MSRSVSSSRFKLKSIEGSTGLAVSGAPLFEKRRWRTPLGLILIALWLLSWSEGG